MRKSVIVSGSPYIGDNIVMINFIISLKNSGYEITYITPKENSFIHDFIKNYIDNFFNFSSLRDVFKYIKLFLTKRFDYAFLLYPASNKKSLFFYIVRAKERIGFYCKNELIYKKNKKSILENKSFFLNHSAYKLTNRYLRYIGIKEKN